jgi:hypothetical protein
MIQLRKDSFLGLFDTIQLKNFTVSLCFLNIIMSINDFILEEEELLNQLKIYLN